MKQKSEIVVSKFEVGAERCKDQFELEFNALSRCLEDGIVLKQSLLKIIKLTSLIRTSICDRRPEQHAPPPPPLTLERVNINGAMLSNTKTFVTKNVGAVVVNFSHVSESHRALIALTVHFV